MQRIFFFGVLMLHTGITTACNVCSCASMGNSLGILPQFRSHFVGVRETYRGFSSRHPASVVNPEGSESRETYHNAEIWGRWYPHRRVQVFGFVPVNHYTRKENGQSRQLSGLGDASLLANYLLFYTPDSSRSRLRHMLLAGVGVKLPTGRFDPGGYAGFQLGSGSADWLANVSYTLRYGRTGLMTEGFYRMNGVNGNGYRYGDRLTASVRAFAVAGGTKMSLLPYAGLSREYSAYDRSGGKRQDYTGGSISMLSLGADIYGGRLQFGGSVQLPVRQDLGEGQITERPRLVFNLVWHFNQIQNCN